MLKGGKNTNKQNTKALPYLQMQWENVSSVPAMKNRVTFPHNIFALLLQGMISCVEKPTEK